VIIEKIEPTEMFEVPELEDTVRGEGGFGSTGVSLHLHEEKK
jgi:dUTPase